MAPCNYYYSVIDVRFCIAATKESSPTGCTFHPQTNQPKNEHMSDMAADFQGVKRLIIILALVFSLNDVRMHVSPRLLRLHNT